MADLNEHELAHLRGLGVHQDPDGALRNARGREVAPGIVARLLRQDGSLRPSVSHRDHQAAKAVLDGRALGGEAGNPPPPVPSMAAVRPEDFQRGYLHDGHQAHSAQGIGGVPSVARDAEPRPAAKAVILDPQRFQRSYLTAGHEANSPAVTGHYATAPMPESHPAEPQDFTRSFLRAGHQNPSPGDQGDNNPVMPGAMGGGLYDSAAAAYNANRAQGTADHVAMTGEASCRPMVPRWSPSPDLGAGNVPTAITIAATRPAPGER